MSRSVFGIVVLGVVLVVPIHGRGQAKTPANNPPTGPTNAVNPAAQQALAPARPETSTMPINKAVPQAASESLQDRPLSISKAQRESDKLQLLKSLSFAQATYENYRQKYLKYREQQAAEQKYKERMASAAKGSGTNNYIGKQVYKRPPSHANNPSAALVDVPNNPHAAEQMKDFARAVIVNDPSPLAHDVNIKALRAVYGDSLDGRTVFSHYDARRRLFCDEVKRREAKIYTGANSAAEIKSRLQALSSYCPVLANYIQEEELSEKLFSIWNMLVKNYAAGDVDPAGTSQLTVDKDGHIKVQEQEPTTGQSQKNKEDVAVVHIFHVNGREVMAHNGVVDPGDMADLSEREKSILIMSARREFFIERYLRTLTPEERNGFEARWKDARNAIKEFQKIHGTGTRVLIPALHIPGQVWMVYEGGCHPIPLREGKIEEVDYFKAEIETDALERKGVSGR